MKSFEARVPGGAKREEKESAAMLTSSKDAPSASFDARFLPPFIQSPPSPPAITVNVPLPAAGGPPDTGASTQRQPVNACSRVENAWPRSTG